jgi:murein DD-endopeptidase MepM/ murein hydrolase activator NlpD
MLNRATRLLLLGCLALPFAFPAAAKNIYKYQDEDGIWHFTDQAPEEGVEFDTVFMEREREARIRLRQEGTRESPLYYVVNEYYGPVEVELKLSDAHNVLTEPDLPARFVIPSRKEQLLVGVGAADPHEGFKYRLHVASVPGKPVPSPVSGLVVYPPFPEGEAHVISQGFNGDKTHLDDDSRYAIDIAMPEGTPIQAVRDGIVMDIEEDFNTGGTDADKYADKANHVRILHDDGTMALYAHLGLAAVRVRPGSRVRAGQLIARSGNTGFSSGPHLHLAIQQNTGMKMISLPFEFRLPGGGSAPPAEMQRLEGILPKR